LIGPTLPPDWQQTEEEDNQLVGPALPPNYSIQSSSNHNEKSDRIIGPQIPNDLLNNNSNNNNINSNESDSDSNEMIGPIPESHEDYDKHNFKFIKNHSIVSMNKSKTNEKVTKREEWMTEIPKPLARKLGFKSVHQFSQKSNKNIDLKPESVDNNMDSVHKNEEMTQLLDSYNKVINFFKYLLLLLNIKIHFNSLLH
jgi:hypothetical protein